MTGLADALRQAEAALSRHFDNKCNGTELRAALNARAALAAHDAAIAAGGWHVGGDRTCGPNAAASRFVRDSRGVVAYMDGGSIADAAARGQRVADCVNACAGIADPVAFIASARAAHDAGARALVELIEAAQRALRESGDVPAGFDPQGAGWWSALYRALVRVSGGAA